jgi:hypothetical protein
VSHRPRARAINKISGVNYQVGEDDVFNEGSRT